MNLRCPLYPQKRTLPADSRMSPLCQKRLRSLIIGGAQPFGEKMQPFPQEPAQFAVAIEKLYGSYLTPERRTGLLANDLKALSALTQDRASIADVLPEMSMPCLLYVGEADPRFDHVKECVKVLANVKFLLSTRVRSCGRIRPQ